MPELDDLQAAIAALEAQRVRLGSEVVDAAIAALREQSATPRAPQPQPLSEGERKQVTVMFADLTGFTALSETADAEDVRNLVNISFQRIGAIVERYGGYIDKFIGDELMVLFGAPVAMEDHAARCLYAALDIRDAVATMGGGHPGLRENPLSVHIGINSGLVVAGAIGTETKREYTVIGDAVNVAARLVGHAQSGEIVLGASTRRLAGDLFVFEDLGAVDLKGKKQRQEIYGLVQVATRRDPVWRSPMVGRDSELQALQDAFQVVEATGRARSVAIIGPPGIGKSRLQREFRAWLSRAHPGATVLRAAALSHMTDSPYFMIGQVLRNWAAISDADTADEARDKLETELAKLEITEAEALEALGTIIGIEFESDVLADLAPEELRARILAAFALFVKAVATAGSAVLILEDLHWADGLSIDLLTQDVPDLEGVPVLYLTLTRPIVDPQAKARQLESQLGRDVHLRITLNELTAESGTELVTSLAPGLDESVVELIAEKGEGNPFFIEEIIGTLRDQGLLEDVGGRSRLTTNWRDINIPDSVWSVLAERIDRLPANDKRVIQSAAVIGRLFWEGLVSDLAFLLARPHLEQLDGRDFVYERGAASFADDREWMFRHVLVQEVAYSGLLKEARRDAHKRAARWLEERVGDRRGEYATALAHHYQLAEEWDKTADFAEIAGDRAAAIFAYREAKVSYLQALQAIAHLSDDSVTRERQVATTIKLARVALYTPTEDVWQQLERAKQFVEESGDSEARVRIIAGMAAWLYSAGRARPSFEMAMQAVAGARAAGLEELLAVPLVIVSRALFSMGDYRQCTEMLEQANALVEKYGVDFDDPARFGFLGVSYIQMGQIARGEALVAENLKVAEQQQNIRRIAAAHLYIGGCDCSLGRLEGAAAHLSAAAAISHDTGDTALKFASLGFLGHLHAQRGEFAKAQECLDTAIGLAAELDSQLNLGLWLAYRADLEIRTGRADEAKATAESAISIARDTRQRPHEAEAHRILAWAKHYSGADSEDVVREFRAAAELHAQTHSLPQQARTAYDLAAFLRLTGRDVEAGSAEAEASDMSRQVEADWLPVEHPMPSLAAKEA